MSKTLQNTKPTTAEQKANEALAKMQVKDVNVAVATTRDELITACNETVAKQQFVTDAKTQTDQAIETVGAGRQALLVHLAEVSFDHQLTLDQVVQSMNDAKEVWLTSHNTKKNTTVDQFLVECRRAMHPACRDIVQEASDIADETWAAETAALKAATENSEKIDTPLRSAFSGRKYHMLAGSNGMLQAYIDELDEKKPEKHGFSQFALDPHELANARQQAKIVDHKAAAKALERFVEAIETIQATFPLPALETVHDYASGIKPEDLLNARNKMLRKQARELAAMNGHVVAASSVPGPNAPIAQPHDKATMRVAAKVAAKLNAKKQASGETTATPANDAIDTLLS